MNEITKVSEIQASDIADYLRLPEVDASTTNTLNNMLGVAKTYIAKYTGQTDLDAYRDFVTVVFVLCQDMYDNRTLYVDSSNLNKMVTSILDMHSVNLLPEADDDENA